MQIFYHRSVDLGDSFVCNWFLVLFFFSNLRLIISFKSAVLFVNWAARQFAVAFAVVVVVVLLIFVCLFVDLFGYSIHTHSLDLDPCIVNYAHRLFAIYTIHCNESGRRKKKSVIFGLISHTHTHRKIVPLQSRSRLLQQLREKKS